MKKETMLEIAVVGLKGFGLIGAACAFSYQTSMAQWANDPVGPSAFQLSLIHWGMFGSGCTALVTFLSTSFGNLSRKFGGGTAGAGNQNP